MNPEASFVLRVGTNRIGLVWLPNKWDGTPCHPHCSLPVRMWHIAHLSSLADLLGSRTEILN